MDDHESPFEPADEDLADRGPPEDGPDEDGPDEDGPEEEISLDALTAAYAGLVAGGEKAPVDEPPATDDGTAENAPNPAEDAQSEGSGSTKDASGKEDDELVSPLGILEAVLFVGNSENAPLTAKQIAALMRGVSPREIDDLVVELNERYRELQCPYEILSQGAGYLMTIRPEYASLRDRFYGTVREARLSQASIDILAVIAYGQPLTREEIDETRGKPSGGVLSQLVRRQLLRIERPDEKPRRPKYYTTDRFLKIMGLEDISELPESQEFDKSF